MPRFDSWCAACAFDEPIIVAGGVHPPCSRCGGATEYIWHSNPASIQTDEAFIGGQVIENLGHDPITVYSRTELKAAMARAGAEQRIKWAGPGDKYLTNWAAGIDQYTLDAATALVSRVGKGSTPDRTKLETFQPVRAEERT